MKIETRVLGSIEVNEKDILQFPEGLFAFEHLHRYTLLQAKEESKFYWLQSLEEPKLAFLLVKIKDLVPNYRALVAPPELSVIGLQTITEAELWGIVTIPHDKPQDMTVNLQGPILINPQNQLGAQFVSADENHPIRASVLELIAANGEA